MLTTHLINHWLKESIAVNPFSRLLLSIFNTAIKVYKPEQQKIKKEVGTTYKYEKHLSS